MTVAYPPPPSAVAARRPVRVWDVVLTIVFLVGEMVVTAIATYLGLFVAMASDGCGSAGTCDDGLIGAGFLFAVVTPVAILLVALIVAVVLLVLRRLAFWVPLLGMALTAAAPFVGAWIAMAGVR